MSVLQFPAVRNRVCLCDISLAVRFLIEYSLWLGVLFFLSFSFLLGLVLFFFILASFCRAVFRVYALLVGLVGLSFKGLALVSVSLVFVSVLHFCLGSFY